MRHSCVRDHAGAVVPVHDTFVVGQTLIGFVVPNYPVVLHFQGQSLEIPSAHRLNMYIFE